MKKRKEHFTWQDEMDKLPPSRKPRVLVMPLKAWVKPVVKEVKR